MKKKSLMLPILFMLALFVFPSILGLCFSRTYPNMRNNLLRQAHPFSSHIITCLNTTTNEIMEFDLEEYIPGVLAAEMPASYEIEALKAQAVAARSFIISRTQSCSDAHPDADICTSPSHCKAWLSKEQALSKWKDSEKKDFWNKLCTATVSTKGEYMIYEDEVVEAFFFANSGGKTEASEDVWGGSRPYLRSVSSEWDTTSPDVFSEVCVSSDFFWGTLKHENPLVDFSISPQISNITLTEGGSVSEITIGGQVFAGTKIRSLFGLKSAKFTIEIQDNTVSFSVMGNGHGVGMSQYGANFMAKSGKKYTEILSHYYSNIQIADF